MLPWNFFRCSRALVELTEPDFVSLWSFIKRCGQLGAQQMCVTSVFCFSVKIQWSGLSSRINSQASDLMPTLVVDLFGFEFRRSRSLSDSEMGADAAAAAADGLGGHSRSKDRELLSFELRGDLFFMNNGWMLPASAAAAGRFAGEERDGLDIPLPNGHLKFEQFMTVQTSTLNLN